MRDTLPEAEAVLIAALRRRSPADRVMDSLRLSDSLRDVAIEALRRRRPNASRAALISEWAGNPDVSAVRHGPVREE